jgi:molecular chaperone DnaK (HSP70)
MAGQPPRTGVNVDEVVALGAAIQASREVGETASDATPQFTLAAKRKITDVNSHSLGAVAVSDDGTRYVNDIIIRRNVPIPAENTKPYLLATHGGANDRLEVYLTQGESDRPADCSILGKYVFSGIEPTQDEVAVDVGLSYDANGVVQVHATQRDTGRELAMAVEPVPDDLSWLDRAPESTTAVRESEPVRVYLLIDVSSSMAGPPLEEAQEAARAFLDRCDFTTAQVGLIAFSDQVTMQAEATDNVRKVLAAVGRLEADGTTNLTDALVLAREYLAAKDRTRYIVILTDGYPDAPESAVWAAAETREEGIQIVAIGTGDADREYLKRLSNTDETAIFAKSGELVTTFGRIARVISEGGRGLRML